MTCAQSEQLTMQALDGALTTRERAALDAHLTACAACRQAWTEYGALAQAATLWAREPILVERHDVFMDEIWARAVAPSKIPSRWQIGWALAAAFAVIGLCIALGPLLPPLLVAPPHFPQSLVMSSTPDLAFDASTWLKNSSMTVSDAFDSLLRPAARSYTLPPWVPVALTATACLNLVLFARVRRRAAS